MNNDKTIRYQVSIRQWQTVVDKEYPLEESEVTYRSEELESALASAIMAHDPPRLAATLAKIVENVSEYTGGSRFEKNEYWPGHNAAVDDFISSAYRIVDGWDKHDRGFTQ